MGLPSNQRLGAKLVENCHGEVLVSIAQFSNNLYLHIHFSEGISHTVRGFPNRFSVTGVNLLSDQIGAIELVRAFYIGLTVRHQHRLDHVSLFWCQVSQLIIQVFFERQFDSRHSANSLPVGGAVFAPGNSGCCIHGRVTPQLPNSFKW
jgi:hypothetical protein